MMGEPEAPAGAEIIDARFDLVALKSTLRSKSSAFVEPVERSTRISGGELLHTSNHTNQVERSVDITPAQSKGSPGNLSSDFKKDGIENIGLGVQKSINESVETFVVKRSIEEVLPGVMSSLSSKTNSAGRVDESAVSNKRKFFDFDSKDDTTADNSSENFESLPNTETKQPSSAPGVPLKRTSRTFLTDMANIADGNQTSTEHISGSVIEHRARSEHTSDTGTDPKKIKSNFIVRRSNPARPIFPPSVGEDSTLAVPMVPSLEEQAAATNSADCNAAASPIAARSATIITSAFDHVASPGGLNESMGRPTMITTPSTLSPFGANQIGPSTVMTVLNPSSFPRHLGIEIRKPGEALPPGSHLQSRVHIAQVVPASMADVIKQSAKLQSQKKLQASVPRKSGKLSAGGHKPHDRSADRIMRSNFFNQIHVGDSVQVVKNQRAGHHDVTNRNPALMGNCGKVVAVPVYPSTWLTVRLDATNQVIKVRTSQIQKLDRGIPLAKHFSNDPLPTMRKKKRGSVGKQGTGSGGKRASVAASKKSKPSKKKKKPVASGRHYTPAQTFSQSAAMGSNATMGMQFAPRIIGSTPMSPGMSGITGMYSLAQAVQCGASPLSPSTRLINLNIPPMNSPHAFIAGRPPLSPFGIRSADMSKDATFQYLDSMYGRDDSKPGSAHASDQPGYKYTGVPMSADGNFLYQNVSPEAMPFSQSTYSSMGDARDQETTQNPHLSPMALTAGFMMLPQTPTTMGGSEMYYFPSGTNQACANSMYNAGDTNRFSYAPSMSPERPQHMSTADHQQSNCDTPSAMETLSNVAALTPRQKVQPDSHTNDNDE